MDASWEWGMECQTDYEKFKVTISTELVLHLPYLDLTFEVHTNASIRVLGGGLYKKGIQWHLKVGNLIR